MRILMLAFSTLSFASLAQATLNDQTWVASTGFDGDPCTRTAPCQTFQTAYDNTSAGGTVSVIDAGNYGSRNGSSASLYITKSITIDGRGVGSIIGAYSNSIAVNAGASGVVIIKNLSINNLGTTGIGIYFVGGSSLRVENVSISGFSGTYAGTGLEVDTTAFATLTVENTTITDCLYEGISVHSTAIVAAELDHVRVRGNRSGVVASNGARVTLRNSEVSMNSGPGVFIGTYFGQMGLAEVDIDNTTLNNNGIGVEANRPYAVARITHNMIMNNGTGLSPEDGGQIISAGDNTVVGNVTDGTPISTLTKR